MGDSENATASTSQVDHPLRSPQDLSTGSEKAWNEDESGSGEGGPSQKKLKRSRTKTGCYGCRGRRIKCDETRPECSHCKRIGLDCVWTVAKDAPVLLAQDKSEQKRSLTACSACRDARARCSHDRPLCVRCAKKGIPCEFPIPRKMFIPAPASSANASAHQPPVPGRAPIQAQLSLPPQRLDLMAAGDLVYAHLDAYFEYVNPVSWHGFLHRGVMYERLAAGSVPRMLLLGLCAVTSTFVSTSQAAAAQAEAWAREVKHDIMDSLDVPQLTTLSATLLVIQFDEAKSRRASVWTILGMAVRQAYALQLNVESTDPNMTWAEREGRRRLMWACYCLDKFVGGGILDVMNVSETSLKIQLPCQDSNFNDQIPCVTPTLSAATEAYFTGDTVTHGTLGLSAHYFLLIYVRARVLRFRRNLTVYHLAPWDSLSEFEVCLLAIQTWRGTLPPDLLFEPSNIHDYASRSQLSAFLSLHMWAIQSACDMAHIAMPGFVELPSPNSLANAPPGWITSTRETCAQKASELSDLFVTVLREVPNFVSGDIGVATCAYQSIRIQIEWVLLARADERPRRREAAVARIDATLKIVRQMNGLWECVDYMYNAVVELLWRHGYSDIPAVSDQFPDPPPSTARPSNRAKPDRWVPALPAVLRRPESNVRDDIEVSSASGAAGGETEWPEDLPENAEWNWLTHGVGVTEEQSFLSLYTYATFDV